MRLIYDVAIIGAGASGSAIAWMLARYNVNTVLIEKEADVCFGVSKANSGIVHGGFHHPLNSLKAKLEIRGNSMFDQMQQDLGFPYDKCGVLMAAYSEEDMPTIRKFYDQGVANGVQGMEICNRERLLQLEPKLKPNVVGGLFCPNAGTIEPYRYVFALVESATKNGVDLRCDFKVAKGVRTNDAWKITSDDGATIQARYVVNAAGLFADEISKSFGAETFKIIPRKGEEYLLDRASKGRPQHVIFPVPSKHSKGVLVIPTVGGTTMIGPTADLVDDKRDTDTTSLHLKRILELVQGMVDGISQRDIISSFAGLRPVMETEDFYIEPSKIVPNFIQVAGIQSPGLTASPAIGEYVKDLLKEQGLFLTEKADYEYTLSKQHEARLETAEKLDELHKSDHAWTHIICRCEKISEAEIVDAIHKGHTTVDGIKFYTRAEMGRCQGGFCSAKILKIISRETGIPMEELTKHGKGSTILAGNLGDVEVKL